MGNTYDQIRRAIADERFYVSWHADERCEERNITPWQLAAEFDDAELLEERPISRPNPTVVVRHRLADGTMVQVVWAWLQNEDKAMIVTAFEPD